MKTTTFTNNNIIDFKISHRKSKILIKNDLLKNTVKFEKSRRTAAINIFDEKFLLAKKRKGNYKKKSSNLNSVFKNMNFLKKKIGFMCKANFFIKKATLEVKKKNIFYNKFNDNFENRINFTKNRFETNGNILKLDIKEIISLLFLLLGLNKNNTSFIFKVFIKDYIKKFKVRNKKFKFLFLNTYFITLKTKKEKLKFYFYCLLFHTLIETEKIVKKNIKNVYLKFFDKSFYTEVKKFSNYLKTKLRKDQKNKMKYFEKTSINLNESIKGYLRKKNFLKIKKRNLHFLKKRSKTQFIGSEKIGAILPQISNIEILNQKNYKNILNYNNKLRNFLTSKRFLIESIKTHSFRMDKKISNS